MPMANRSVKAHQAMAAFAVSCAILLAAGWAESQESPAGGEVPSYWTVEVAIPFADLYEMPPNPPRDGDMWRLNVYPIERDNPVEKTEIFLAAFSPPYSREFHATWMFGKV